jgi:hypothetical protein
MSRQARTVIYNIFQTVDKLQIDMRPLQAYLLDDTDEYVIAELGRTRTEPSIASSSAAPAAPAKRQLAALDQASASDGTGNKGWTDALNDLLEKEHIQWHQCFPNQVFGSFIELAHPPRIM